ncbi:glycosyltransferase family 39 protein [Amycolatopsis sp. GM8]|uniref:glycosyltransferase family 39 protein n=1 Tax=Amycolatopsis sp. GM8 TaxID=2896530 RepID=UPI001F222441|nr:glycosyltransferase family 39 protein [Amycolatopsis sp. GM8]
MVIVAVAVWFALAAVVLCAWPRFGRTGVPLLALAFALLQQLIFSTVPDSAFLTFRYAANIAAGHGAVFNIGEYVEGYTNFAWLVLVTLPKALFGADIVTGAVVLSSACALGCVLLAGRFSRLAAVLTAAVSGLAAYECAGTETPLFVLLVLAVGYALTTRHPLAAGVLTALAVMTRPDGLILAGAAVLWLVLGAARRRSTWWAPVGYLLGALVLVVPWLVWRTTYYEKLSGWPALHASFPAYAFLGATLAAVVVGRLLEQHRKPSPTPRATRRWAPVVALLLCAVSFPFAAYQRPGVLDWRSRLAETAEISDWLATRLPPGSIISTGGGGALAYGVGTRLTVVTPHRDDEDYEFVVSLQEPALTITGLGYSARQQCDLDPAYAGLYAVATFLRQGAHEWVTVYPREDQATALIKRLDQDPRLSYVPCP